MFYFVTPPLGYKSWLPYSDVRFENSNELTMEITIALNVTPCSPAQIKPVSEEATWQYNTAVSPAGLGIKNDSTGDGQ
jgi:hypothetical protein